MTTFAPIFVPDELRRATSDAAWLDAMLEVERALALVEGRLGIVPADAASAIGERCRAELFELDGLLAAGRSPGNPVEPLVRALRELVGDDAADYVHWGATSQDVVDTAAMLVSRRALDLVLAELDGVANGAAALAEQHAQTLMVARTLLQQASPTTFGLKAAGWLSGVLEAHAAIFRVRDDRLAVQLGGAVGTLAAFGDRGLEVLAELADELELERPLLPWHTDRTRVAELAAALELAAAAASKIALDVVLLAQSEVAEVRVSGGGASSTLPHKQNPIAATRALACARGAHAASTLLRGGEHEHERAVGSWHAEWNALSEALAFTGGAAAAARELLAGLEVDSQRMRENLDASQGLVMAERLSFLLAEHLGRREAQQLVADAVAGARANGRSLRDELAGDDRVALSGDELDSAFDASGYLGAAGELVERVLVEYRSRFAPEPQ